MTFDQALINAAMRPWCDAEFRRFAFRVALFGRRGMDEDTAEIVADRLARRDQQHDDRRICFECANWQRSRTCFLNLPTSPLQLVRCHGFEWVKP